MKNEDSNTILALKNSMIEKLKWFMHIFLLSLWVFILFFMARPFDALILISLFLIFILFRQRAFLLLAASVLVIVLFNTPILVTLTKLKEINLSTYHHVSPALAQLFRPDSGQHVLPKQVRQMLSLIQIHQVTSYRLSKTLDQDAWIQQRMIEAAWPIKMESTSPFIFCAIEDLDQFPNCTIIAREEDVALGTCH